MDLDEKLKKEQTEKEEIDKLFTKFQEEIAETREIINMYNCARLENRELDNIAIIINNKIVELSHKFKEKGILFYSESALESLILKEFKVLYNLSKTNLKKAILIYLDLERNIDYISDETYTNNINQASLYIDIYQNFADKIWKFDIEKDIVKIILDERADYPDKEKYEHTLERYKQELKILGYENVLHDLSTQIKSLDEKEEFFERLKFNSIINQINQGFQAPEIPVNNQKEIIE